MNSTRFYPIVTALKLLLLVFMGVVIYRRWSSVEHFIGSGEEFIHHFLAGNLFYLLAVVCLMPINWLLEALKWQLLLRHSTVIDIGLSLRSILGGLSIGFATPARVGEFAGRVMFLPEGKRLSGIYLSALGGIAQSIITFVTALLLLRFYVGDATVFLSKYGYVGFLLLFSFLIYLYLRYELVLAWLGASGWPIQQYLISPSSTPTTVERTWVIVISAIRYGVYMGQYYLLLRFIGIGGSALALLAAVSLILFLQSVSPLIPLADMTVRGGIALLVFNHVGSYMAIGIFMVPVMLWVINLLLPALVGYIYILNLKPDEPLHS